MKEIIDEIKKAFDRNIYPKGPYTGGKFNFFADLKEFFSGKSLCTANERLFLDEIKKIGKIYEDTLGVGSIILNDSYDDYSLIHQCQFKADFKELMQ